MDNDTTGPDDIMSPRGERKLGWRGMAVLFGGAAVLIALVAMVFVSRQSG